MPQKDHPFLDVSRDEIVPYFMWDYQYTVGKIRETLSGDDEYQRIWLMAKIMRDARYKDVWKFMTLQDFLRYRERLMPRLGREKGYWEFLYSRWVKYGIVKDDGDTDTSSK